MKINHLHHQEMNLALQQFLRNHFNNKPFSLADLGCGDGRTLLELLLNTSITHYIGVDIAKDLIEKAPEVFKKLQCEKEFICEDMSTAFTKLTAQLDIIFSGYALHHLSYDEKVTFINNCYKHLAHNGYFILIDIVTEENQSRSEWYTEFVKRFHKNNPNLSAEETERRLAHPKDYDFPESINTYQNISKMQGWRTFENPLAIDGCAFMIFGK